MHRFLRRIVSRLYITGFCALTVPTLPAQTPVPQTSIPRASVPRVSVPKTAGSQTSVRTNSIRTIKVLGSKDAVEIEVEASDRIVPQTQILTAPDRLVVDFPNAVPSNQLRSQSVDQGEVKDLRVGLLQSKPPVTRVVLDLKSAQSYQLFPYGRTVIIKVMGGEAEGSARIVAPVLAPAPPAPPAARSALVAANYTTRTEPVKVGTSDQPLLEVTFRDGLLGIRADKVTLAEVLFAVQQRTGAVISLAAGAEQEKVVADIAPAPATEVLARLLNGSNFNFLILSAPNDPARLDRVILSVRPEGGFVPQPPPIQVQNQVQNPVQNDDPVEPEPARMNLQPGHRVPRPPQAPAQPDGKTPAGENTPDQ
jgi:AMIN domain